MQELIKATTQKTGITEEKALNVLLTISSYIKQKYPLLEGVVDSVLEVAPEEIEQTATVQ